LEIGISSFDFSLGFAAFRIVASRYCYDAKYK